MLIVADIPLRISLLLAHAGHDPGGGWALPPLHPILVNFTAALIPVSVFTDLMMKVRPRESLRSVGWWTLLYAACLTPITALTGWYWLRQMPGMDDQMMTVHKWLGSATAIFLLFVLWCRWTFFRVNRPTNWPYIFVGLILVFAVVIQGHIGGRMSFGDAPDGRSAPTPHPDSSAQSRPRDAQPKTGIEWKDHLELGN